MIKIIRTIIMIIVIEKMKMMMMMLMMMMTTMMKRKVNSTEVDLSTVDRHYGTIFNITTCEDSLVP